MKKIYFVPISFFISATALASNENFLSGARPAALGNTSTTLYDAWSATHNQAGLGFMHTISAGIYYENRFLIKELSNCSGVLAIPFKAGTIGMSLTDFGYALYKENKYSLSFARIFSKTVSIGMALDYLSTRITDGYRNFNTLIGEIGIQAKLSKNLIIGTHLYNPTRSKLGKDGHEHIPTILRLGMSYSFSSTVLLLAETEKDIAKKAIFKAGLEYEPLTHFYLRIGISTEPVLTTVGLGVHVKNFQIDLSSNYHQILGITPQLGLTYLFHKRDEIVRDGT